MRGLGTQARQLQLRHGEDHPRRVRRGGRAHEGVPPRHARVPAGWVLQGSSVRVALCLCAVFFYILRSASVRFVGGWCRVGGDCLLSSGKKLTCVSAVHQSTYRYAVPLASHAIFLPSVPLLCAGGGGASPPCALSSLSLSLSLSPVHPPLFSLPPLCCVLVARQQRRPDGQV